MAIYVYRRHRSTGALDLARELGGVRLRSLDGVTRPIQPGDRIVCWGESLASSPDIHILNGAALRNKFEDAVQLRAAGIPTVQVSRTRPAPTPVGPPPPDPALLLWEDAQDKAEAFDGLTFARGPVILRAMQEMVDAFSNLRTALTTPPPVAVATVQGEWLGRTLNHVGGTDLLTPPAAPEFYSKKENIVREYRIHSFLGRSIRAGKKAWREGYGTAGVTRHAHPWIRSYDGGWRIVYDNFESTRPQRDLAHAACSALGLQFAAVDLGEKADGSLIVLECNRAPGLENNTVTSYASAVRNWMAGDTPAR